MGEGAPKGRMRVCFELRNLISEIEKRTSPEGRGDDTIYADEGLRI